MSQTPYAAEFENKISAEAAASVRNAVFIEFSGRINKIEDYYKRDDQGNPIPIEWRDLIGQVHVPWLKKPQKP